MLQENLEYVEVWIDSVKEPIHFLWPWILRNPKKGRSEIAQKEQNIKNTDAAEIGGI